jgi:hypothetical protein
MATEAPTRTHCPNCGAKLKRPDLSLCAYCAMPLNMGGKSDAPRDETLQRLQRMREHANFPAAQAYSPLDPRWEARVTLIRNRGGLVAVVGLLVALVVFGAQFVGQGIRWESVWTWVGPAVFAIGALVVMAAKLFAGGQDRRALLVRPAIVMERRSEISQKGMYGAQTMYFFTLRFDDGSEGEFRWPGQGLSNEPMVNGQVGVAYTRGEDLVSYRKLT